MANRQAILIDLNIILDVLQKREPFYESAASLLAAAETGKIDGYVAAHRITTLFYLFEKDKGRAEAKAAITNLLQIPKIAPIDQDTIEQALNLDLADFENAVQMMAAVQCKLDCLISRNTKGFQPGLLPVLQPVDYLASL